MSLSFGIIGTNFITERFIEAARECGDNIHSVYSRSADTGASFSEKHNIPKYYTSLDEFLADKDVDVVYVASPNFLHKAHTIAALDSGKHVLCEKPIASNSTELKDMLDAASRNKRILLEAMRPEFDPSVSAIKDNIYKIGTVRRAVIDFSQYSSRYDKFKNGEILNAFNPALSNAAVMDIGVYCIHLCHMLFGKPQSIISESIFLNNGFEGSGVALFKYDGFIVDIQYSKIANSTNPCYIQGENATLTFSGVQAPRDICVHYRSGETEKVESYSVDNNMIYEIREMERLISERACTHNHTYMSILEMEALDRIRNNNGIRFPADKQGRMK